MSYEAIISNLNFRTNKSMTLNPCIRTNFTLLWTSTNGPIKTLSLNSQSYRFTGSIN